MMSWELFIRYLDLVLDTGCWILATDNRQLVSVSFIVSNH
jgi:hypothetical protein